MLSDSVDKAFSTANRLVSVARQKAAELPGDLAISGNGAGIPQRRENISHAREQYEHNRGWVWACIRLIAQRVAAQPVHVSATPVAPNKGDFVHKSAFGDDLEPLEQHTLLDVLAIPNPLMTCWSLMFVTVASLELTGRSLWFVTDEDSRRVIFPIPTSWIDQVDRKRAVWKIRLPESSNVIPLPGDRVVHFYYPNPADPWGVISPLQQIAGAVTADEAIEQTHWRTFTQGQFPGLILTAGRLPNLPGMSGPGTRPNLTPEQRSQLISSIRKAYQGVHNWNEPLILDGLIERVEKLTYSPQELDFLNSAKLTKAKILQGYGVSPILLGEVEGANRASATVADEIFVANKINPLITLLSQAMSTWLSHLFANPNERLKVWIEPAKARDRESELKTMQFGAARGLVTVNEWRRFHNLSPIPDGDELIELPSATPAVKSLADLLNPYTMKPLADGHRVNGNGRFHGVRN